MIPLLHRWIWHDAERRARKLLTFAETEADGGRDLLRAAELTQDPTLRLPDNLAGRLALMWARHCRPDSVFTNRPAEIGPQLN